MTVRPIADAWVGPLGGWELIRAARRGYASRARITVLLFVLVAAIALPIWWFSGVDAFETWFGARRTVTIRQEAVFASHFALALVDAVLLAVGLLAPAFAANAISEEKERRTLTVLQLSLLSDREIVLGKALGRFGVILAAAGAVVPVLTFTMMLGGVGPRFVVASVVVVLSTGFTATAIGIEAAVYSKSLKPALFRAYGFMLFAVFGLFGPLYFTTPFAVLQAVQTSAMSYRHLFVLVGGFAAAHFVLSNIFLVRAILRFRHERSPALRSKSTRHRPQQPVYVRVQPFEPRNYRRPLIRKNLSLVEQAYLAPARTRPWMDEEDPILWKERYISGAMNNAKLVGVGRASLAVASLVCFMFVFVGAAEIMHEWNWSEPPTLAARASLIRGASFALGLFAVPAAIRLAPSVSRERQRQTLDALLMLPTERSALLWKKTKAAIESTWAWMALAIPTAGWGYLSAGNWLMGLLAALSVAMGAFFVVTFGAVLSVSCSTEVRAFRFLMPAVAFVIGLPAACFYLTDWHRTIETTMVLTVVPLLMFIFGMMAWKLASEKLQAA